jgi:hypothetical protein
VGYRAVGTKQDKCPVSTPSPFSWPQRKLSGSRRAASVVLVPSRQYFVKPQDLGKRVSFQYELPNGYVGEAVGILEEWDEAANTYLVRNKDGRLQRVPALGVRFGKVIPG